MLSLNLTQFSELRSVRLLLRELVPVDAPALFAIRTDERAMRMIARPGATTLQDARQLITTIAADRAANTGITWAITLHGSNTLIGTIGFYRIKPEHHCAEVGYLLHPDQWGRGFMGEALDAVVEHGSPRSVSIASKRIPIPGMRPPMPCWPATASCRRRTFGRTCFGKAASWIRSCGDD